MLERSLAGLPPHEKPHRFFEPREPFDACEPLAGEQRAADHRGQVHAMLAGTSVEPPQLDEFFCTAEADLRAADFAELGFTETQVWGPRAAPPA